MKLIEFIEHTIEHTIEDSTKEAYDKYCERNGDFLEKKREKEGDVSADGLLTMMHSIIYSAKVHSAGGALVGYRDSLGLPESVLYELNKIPKEEWLNDDSKINCYIDSFNEDEDATENGKYEFVYEGSKERPTKKLSKKYLESLGNGA